MKRTFLSFLFTIALTSISQISKAQTSSNDTLAADPTIYDDRTLSGGHELRLPQPTTDWETQYKFINKEFSASQVLKKNRTYTKVEITSIVEKDGSVSAYSVKGTGPEAMKNELIRILKLSPRYKPGTRDGQPVRCKINQPFEFKYN
jgi:hypothetical protein